MYRLSKSFSCKLQKLDMFCTAFLPRLLGIIYFGLFLQFATKIWKSERWNIDGASDYVTIRGVSWPRWLEWETQDSGPSTAYIYCLSSRIGRAASINLFNIENLLNWNVFHFLYFRWRRGGEGSGVGRGAAEKGNGEGVGCVAGKAGSGIAESNV